MLSFPLMSSDQDISNALDASDTLLCTTQRGTHLSYYFKNNILKIAPISSQCNYARLWILFWPGYTSLTINDYKLLVIFLVLFRMPSSLFTKLIFNRMTRCCLLKAFHGKEHASALLSPNAQSSRNDFIIRKGCNVGQRPIVVARRTC